MMLVMLLFEASGTPSSKLATDDPELALKVEVGFACVKLGVNAKAPPPYTKEPPPVPLMFRTSAPMCTECAPRSN